MGSLITQPPVFGESIVDARGRATRKFVKYLESIEVTETTSTTDQIVQDAIGNLAGVQSFIARINQDITNITTLSADIQDVEVEANTNSGKIGQLLALVARLTGDVGDISQLLAGQSGQAFLIASLKRELDYPSVPAVTVAEANTDVRKAGSLVYVTDETGGATLAASDGTNWQRCTDLTNIA